MTLSEVLSDGLKMTLRYCAFTKRELKRELDTIDREINEYLRGGESIPSVLFDSRHEVVRFIREAR